MKKLNENDEKIALKVLNTDTLLEAEKITGQSYKESEETSSLGLLLQIAHAEQKKKMLEIMDDTTFSMDWDKWQTALSEFGFRKVFEDTAKRNKYEETYTRQLWFHDKGLLLFCDSFHEQRNSATVWYNWKPNKDLKRHEFTSSGSYHIPNIDPYENKDEWDKAWNEDKAIWVGHHDAREALFFNMQRLMDNGKLIFPWVKSPFVYISNEDENGEHCCDTEKVLDQLPQEIKDGIGIKEE